MYRCSEKLSLHFMILYFKNIRSVQTHKWSNIETSAPQANTYVLYVHISHSFLLLFLLPATLQKFRGTAVVSVDCHVRPDLYKAFCFLLC